MAGVEPAQRDVAEKAVFPMWEGEMGVDVRHTCVAACTSRWPPGPRCHCTQCGLNFLTPTAFDQHRWHKRSADGCADPIAIGLARAQNDVWGEPAAVCRAEEKAAQITEVNNRRGRSRATV